MSKDYFVIEFTYCETNEVHTTYAGTLLVDTPLAFSTPFLSYDKAKKFKSVDEVRAWLADALKNIDAYSDFAFTKRKLKSVKVVCVPTSSVEDITAGYISRIYL